MKRGFMMTTFTIHTVESAPAEVKEVLETVQKRQQWLYSQPNRSLGQTLLPRLKPTELSEPSTVAIA